MIVDLGANAGIDADCGASDQREWQLAIEPLHQDLQHELATISSESKQIVARKAGHNIQLDEPQLVLDAITSLVRRYRAQ